MKKDKTLNEMFQSVCGISINEDYDGGGSSIFYKDIEGNAVGGSERNYNDFGESELPVTYVKRQVKYLQKGDKLGSGMEVIVAPVVGLRTPAGKVEIGIRYANGKEKMQFWNKNTEVSVKQETPTI